MSIQVKMYNADKRLPTILVFIFYMNAIADKSTSASGLHSHLPLCCEGIAMISNTFLTSRIFGPCVLCIGGNRQGSNNCRIIAIKALSQILTP